MKAHYAVRRHTRTDPWKVVQVIGDKELWLATCYTQDHANLLADKLNSLPESYTYPLDFEEWWEKHGGYQAGKLSLLPDQNLKALAYAAWRGGSNETQRRFESMLRAAAPKD